MTPGGRGAWLTGQQRLLPDSTNDVCSREAELLTRTGRRLQGALTFMHTTRCEAYWYARRILLSLNAARRALEVRFVPFAYMPVVTLNVGG